MVEDLINHLRDRASEFHGYADARGAASYEMKEAADLIEQQAARLTALESERDALLNSLAAARQDASTAWERHAMATRVGNAAAGELATVRGRIVELERKHNSVARLLCRHGDGKLCMDGAQAAALENGDGRDAKSLPVTDKQVEAALAAFNEFPCPMNGGISRCWNTEQMRAAIDAALSQKAGEQQ